MYLRLKRLWECRSGNFAVISALGAVPLVFAMGAAIDTSRVLSAKLGLQDAIDSAALAIVKHSDFDQALAEQIAQQMVSANHNLVYRDLTVTLTDFGAIVEATSVVDMSLTRILGYQQLTARVRSTATFPPTKFEVALVLDTTGSMAGSRITEMRTAAKNMIDTLTATEVLRRRMTFALVPFSTYVNVDPGNAKASWLDTGGLQAVPGSVFPKGVERLRVFGNFRQSWPGCIETRVDSGDTLSIDDTPPNSKNPRTLFMPALAPDEPDSIVNGWHLFPNDYMSLSNLLRYGVIPLLGTYQYTLAVKDVAPYRYYSNVSDPQGPGWDCVSDPLVPLTNQYDRVKTRIAELQAAGSTNIGEGVAWGMRVLTPREPFTEGLDKKEDVQKIMIVLTDGDNSVPALPNDKASAYSSYGHVVDGRMGVPRGKLYPSGYYGYSKTADLQVEIQKRMDAQTQSACTNAKAEGIEIYTIRLEVDTATSASLLTSCASDPKHFYDVTSASQLQKVFDDISSRIKVIRITS